jgi:hypothetical protein
MAASSRTAYAPVEACPPSSEDEGEIALGSSPSVCSARSVSPLAMAGESSEDGDRDTGLLCGAPDEESEWTPGVDTGKWVGPNAPVGLQSQVLLANAVLAIRSLPKDLCRTVLARLAGKDALPRRRHAGLAFSLTAHLLRLSSWAVRSIFEGVKGNAWKPLPPKEKFGRDRSKDVFQDAGGAEACPPPDKEDEAFQNLVRIALSNAVEGRSFLEFERDVLRYRLASAAVGVKYADAAFTREVTALSSSVLQQLDALDFNKALAGLGIPSDIAVLADPVSIGLQARARHDVLLIVCLCLARASNTAHGAVAPGHGPAGCRACRTGYSLGSGRQAGCRGYFRCRG